MPAYRDDLDAVTRARVPHLWHCDDSETLGLGRCQCNSHSVFGRLDSDDLTPEDIDDFWAAVKEADALHAWRMPARDDRTASGPVHAGPGNTWD